MRGKKRAATSSARWILGKTILAAGMVVAIGLVMNMAATKQRNAPVKAKQASVVKPDGKELFLREWIAGDPRSHGGDGLGPVFNDSSCVACHNQGGAGGGGPASKNVHILTKVSSPPNGQGGQSSFVLHHHGTDGDYAKWRARMAQSAAMTFGGDLSIQLGNTGGVGIDRFVAPQQGGAPNPPIPAQNPPGAGQQSAGPGEGGAPGGVPPQGGNPVAPPGAGTPPAGFPGGGQVVLGIGGSGMIFGSFSQISQRNTTALFGAGKIDAIDERTLEEAAKKTYPKFLSVSGRVARDKEGRIGRFGWKAQKAGLEDFVLTACAVEVGLHVPGHEQPPMPHKPKYKSPGLDMNKEECDALVDYVRSLPSPTDLIDGPQHPKHAEYLNDGKKLFASVGCAACHTETLGDVAGIYSDLLLHDMGPGLTDIGSSYGVLRPSSPGEGPQKPSEPPKDDEIAKGKKPRKPPVVAAAAEWRTPPLWGVRDSAPYLHDGRANTLERAIAFHGGEAVDSTKRFSALSAQDKQKLIAFLKSLVAPDPS